MTTEGFYAEEVGTGARFLDQHMPGWAPRIDRDKLGLASRHNCTLGQLCGSYSAGLRELGISDSRARKMGFDVGQKARRFFPFIAYPVITAAWKTEIEARQQRAVAA